jgi:integrase
VTVSTLTLSEAGRIIREAMRDESYRLLPMGQEVDAYMRVKRKQLTQGSERKYRAALAELALHFPDLELKDFEPPVGTERLEEFMDARWGHLAPRTYNSCQDQVRGIVASQDDLRDRIALRLLLNYALRKSELRAVQFKHFDHVRLRLTVFGKGGTVVAIPIPDPAFWHDLERLILDAQAEPSHYLMPGRRGNRHGTRLLPDSQISNHGLHDWWYACLARAGVVADGVTKGERMHKGRHTAGQALLDATGNLKAVQKLLRHKSMLTTADVYLDWDLDQLAQSLAETLERDR